MRRSRLSAGGKRKQIIKFEGERIQNVTLYRVEKIRGTFYNLIKSNTTGLQ